MSSMRPRQPASPLCLLLLSRSSFLSCLHTDSRGHLRDFKLHHESKEMERHTNHSTSKDYGLKRPLSSGIRPTFYPCTGLHLPHPLSVRTHPAAAGALANVSVQRTHSFMYCSLSERSRMIFLLSVLSFHALFFSYIDLDV